jgi:hypothetical protein
VVHGAHAVGLKHAVLLGEVLLRESLLGVSALDVLYYVCNESATGETYDFIVVVADLLAHELVGPGLDA